MSADPAAIRLAVEAAMPEHEDGFKLLATFALSVYDQVRRQGANEIEAIATVYHAGMTHIREAEGMSYEQAVDVFGTSSAAQQELVRKAAAYDAINTPQISDFLRAVENEALHQRDRWGVDHDAGKRAEDWIALLIYLIGKATKSHYDGDADKLLHHVITTAAACLNWHAALTGAHTRMRPGVAPAQTS